MNQAERLILEQVALALGEASTRLHIFLALKGGWEFANKETKRYDELRRAILEVLGGATQREGKE